MTYQPTDEDNDGLVDLSAIPDAIKYADEKAQDAIGAILGPYLDYDDAAPSIGINALLLQHRPNLHLPGTELEASGGNDTATQSIGIPAGQTFTLHGYGLVSNAGSAPGGVTFRVMGGNLTGTPTTEFTDTTPSIWKTGSPVVSVTAGSSSTAVHIQMVNTNTSAVNELSLLAGYEVK